MIEGEGENIEMTADIEVSVRGKHIMPTPNEEMMMVKMMYLIAA